MNGGGSQFQKTHNYWLSTNKLVTNVSICFFFFFFAASNLISRLMREHHKPVGKSLQYVFHPVGAITPCTWSLPVLKLELKRRHRLDSNDSEEYLSICCHLHTLQTRVHHIELSVGGPTEYFASFWIVKSSFGEDLPFGWNILETNRTVGGLFGYSSVNSIVSLKVPKGKIKKKFFFFF